MWVHASSASGADVAAARATIVPSGQIGRRCYVERAPAALLPFAAEFVDLVVITNLTDATVSSLARAEVLRVLSTSGTAFVGRATAEGAGLSASALQSWTGGQAGITVTTDALGTWAVVVKPQPAASALRCEALS
jgi:short subunit dehydrogenase-like uncharacterized protein